jgi:hypothetical protein
MKSRPSACPPALMQCVGDGVEWQGEAQAETSWAAADPQEPRPGFHDLTHYALIQLSID